MGSIINFLLRHFHAVFISTKDVVLKYFVVSNLFSVASISGYIEA